jgi:hypothetical protein
MKYSSALGPIEAVGVNEIVETAETLTEASMVCNRVCWIAFPVYIAIEALPQAVVKGATLLSSHAIV